MSAETVTQGSPASLVVVVPCPVPVSCSSVRWSSWILFLSLCGSRSCPKPAVGLVELAWGLRCQLKPFGLLAV